MNSFKLLEEENELHYSEQRRLRVESKVNSTLGAFRFIGEVVDVYLPRLVDTIVEVAGGSGPATTSRRPPSGPAEPRPPSLGPVNPGKLDLPE